MQPLIAQFAPSARKVYHWTGKNNISGLTTIPAPILTYTAHSITHGSCHQAAEVLARAFVDDPVTVAVYKNFTADRRIRALMVDFGAEVRECVRRGCPLQIDDDGQVIAAAVIYPPRTYPLPVMIQWLLLIQSVLGNGFYNLGSWLRWLNEVEKFRPTEPHYYLEYIGVEPGRQRQDVGSTLIWFLMNKVDEAHVGCYLENANPRNLSFYQRFGFQVVDEKEIIGVPTWFMWRKPSLV